jgi:hypothetical protein
METAASFEARFAPWSYPAQVHVGLEMSYRDFRAMMAQKLAAQGLSTGCKSAEQLG